MSKGHVQISKLKKGQLIEVEWEDAFGTPKWQESDDQITSLLVRSVGYVVKVQKNGLAMCGGFQVDNPGSFNSLGFIPTGMLRKVRVIRG